MMGNQNTIDYSPFVSKINIWKKVSPIFKPRSNEGVEMSGSGVPWFCPLFLLNCKPTG